MNFFSFLWMKSKSAGGLSFWVIVLFTLIILSLRFPPLVVILIGLFFRQYQNYIEWKEAAKRRGPEDETPRVFSVMTRVLFPLMGIVMIFGFIMIGNLFLKRNEDVQYTMYSIFLIILYVSIMLKVKFLDRLRRTSVQEDHEYLYENKRVASDKIQKIDLKKMKEQSIKEKESERVPSSGDVRANFPPNINPKLYIKPREKKTNIVSYGGSKPVTLLSKEYAQEVNRVNEIKKEQDRILVQAANRFVRRESSGFKVRKACVVCGNHGYLEKNGIYICEFCGAQIN